MKKLDNGGFRKVTLWREDMMVDGENFRCLGDCILKYFGIVQKIALNGERSWERKIENNNIILPLIKMNLPEFGKILSGLE